MWLSPYKMFFCFFFFIYPLSSFQPASNNICHMSFVSFDFSSTFYLCFCTFSCACSVQNDFLNNWRIKLKYTYISNLSLHNIVNMMTAAIKRNEFSHFNARLWRDACLVLLAVKGGNRLGYSVSERPLMSVLNSSRSWLHNNPLLHCPLLLLMCFECLNSCG